MREEQRRKITTITTSRTSYGASSNRSAFGYWVPLAITLTAATVALGAWIWSERDDKEESESENEHYYASTSKPSGRHDGGLSGAATAAGTAGLGAAAGYASMSGGLPPGPGPAGSQQQPPPGSFAPQPPLQGGFKGPPPGSMPPGASGEAAGFYNQENQSRAMSTGVSNTQQDDSSFLTRMTNAVGSNTWAGKSLAAAGSMVGGAVNAVRGAGDDGQAFSDQERWSEEADKPERTMSPRKSTGTVAGAGADVSRRGLQRTGTAAEFYSGAVDAPRRSSVASKKRRTVAVVVSAVDRVDDGLEVDAHQSILAHLPGYINPDTTRIIVLIYDPELHTHPLSLISRRASERHTSVPSVRSQSTSSYAKINTPGANGTPAQTPGDFPHDNDSDDKGILAHIDPKPEDSNTSLSRRDSRDDRSEQKRETLAYPATAALVRERSNELIPTNNPLDVEANPLFKTLYNQANALVDRDTSILPFTSRDGHKHILRSIQPETLYIQESLCGTDGSLVSELRGWVRSIVVVIGDEGGFGGLIDSDTEDERGRRKQTGMSAEKWWKKESVTGVGRGVSVVESLNVGDDWRRRVNDEE
ncbi:hypothetical protein LTS08_007651 [Lithohypha guttulata]|nr:hypothetical protein LTS08_007651 [Lithohypha guttulata]